MSSLNSQYLNNGDMVKIPQQTYIYAVSSLRARVLSDVGHGFIVETSRDNNFYKILFEEEFWYVDKNDVSWMGV